MAQLMLINPRRRSSGTRKKTASSKRRIRRNPVAASSKRRIRRNPVAAIRKARRNPAPRRGNGIMTDVMDAAIGATGAVAVNAVYNMLPLPDSMKTGMGATLGKAASAIALGMIGKPLLGRAAGKMAAGAMTVIAYDVIKGLLPASTVAGLGYINPGLPAGYLPQQGVGGVGEYVDTRVFSSGMGEYVY